MPIIVDKNAKRVDKDAPPKPIQTFRLLRGRHVDRKDGKRITYEAGEIIETTADLLKFNSIDGHKKYEKLDPNQLAVIVAQAAAVKEDMLPPPSSGGVMDTYSSMSLDELKKFAKEESIPLGNAKTKEEVLKVLAKSI